MPTVPSEVLSTTLAPARGSPDFKTHLHTATAIPKWVLWYACFSAPQGFCVRVSVGTPHTLLPRLRFTEHITACASTCFVGLRRCWVFCRWKVWGHPAWSENVSNRFPNGVFPRHVSMSHVGHVLDLSSFFILIIFVVGTRSVVGDL